MQVSKTYSGSVVLEEKTEKRECSYGDPSKTITCYPSKVDTLNLTIARFLQYECGVDAWYGPGSLSDDNFLWIFGVPFLFGISGSNNYPTFYPPCGLAGRTCSTYFNGTAPTISLFNKELYSFGLVFGGNPNTGFWLRFKPYNSASISNTLVLRFMKAENIINGADSVLWSAYNYHSLSAPSATATSPLYTGWLGIDIGGRYKIEQDSVTRMAMLYTCELYSVADHFIHNEGALPLVNLMVGPYRANGIYMRPRYFNLPVANGNTVEVQNEITIDGRSFLITASDTMSASTPNMGLIETT